MKFVTAHGDGGIWRVECEQAFHEIWLDAIIGIDKTKKSAGRFFEASITSGGLALVFLGEDDNTRIFFGVSLDDFRRFVGGAVIYKDNFKILISLA